MRASTYAKIKINEMQPLAQLARALADETRLRILTVLLEGAATVSDLVTRLGVPQPRVSTQLALLRDAGLVSVHGIGRQRIYDCDGERVGAVLAALRVLTPVAPRRVAPSAQAARAVRHNTALRQARTCYGHLAGVAGVQLLDDLLRRGWLEVQEGTQPHYHLTPRGAQALLGRGVDLVRARKARRVFAYGCLDWTERRPHLGGALGAAILEALAAAGVIRREKSSRAVAFLKPVSRWLAAAANRTVPS